GRSFPAPPATESGTPDPTGTGRSAPRTATAVHTPARTGDQQTAPGASRDRRVGLRSWPRWYLQQPERVAKPAGASKRAPERPRSRSEGTPRPPPSGPEGTPPRARLIPNRRPLPDHRRAFEPPLGGMRL